MTEAMDPAIKLFGRTIPMPEGQMPPDPASPAMAETATEGEVEDLCGEVTETEVRARMLEIPDEINRRQPASSSGLSSVEEDNHQISTQEVTVIVDPKTDQNHAEDSNSGQEKLLKKPDKILPCPRCKSMDTKFCYYNNYNVNQPRHFCKNCQRYWTAGGVMRNVPVGAGRRKTKQSLSQRHVMMIADKQPRVNLDAPSSAPHHILPGESSAQIRPLKGNGAVLNFGPEAPICESMASVLSLGDQERSAETKSEDSLEKHEESSHACSTIASNHVENEGSKSAVHKEPNETPGYSNGITPMHHLPCYRGPPFVFPWSPNPISWNQPIFTASAVTYPFMPAPFWGCMSNWPNGVWNVPWLQPHGHLPPSSATNDNNCTWNEPPTLGKHSRDASKDGEDNAEKKSLWVPKTLRINDPDEAAKSSIWATLGIKPNESFGKGGIFKNFQARTVNKDVAMNASQVLKANPAALCRSQTFQERT